MLDSKYFLCEKMKALRNCKLIFRFILFYFYFSKFMNSHLPSKEVYFLFKSNIYEKWINNFYKFHVAYWYYIALRPTLCNLTFLFTYFFIYKKIPIYYSFMKLFLFQKQRVKLLTRILKNTLTVSLKFFYSFFQLGFFTLNISSCWAKILKKYVAN